MKRQLPSRVLPKLPMQWCAIASVCLFIGSLLQSSAAAPVEQGQAAAQTKTVAGVYEISLGRMTIARHERRVMLTDGGYRISAQTMPAGMARLLSNRRVSQLSEGRIDPEGKPLPLRFHFTDSGKQRDFDYQFDYDGGLVQSAALDAPMSVVAGLQDEASVLLLLRVALEAGAGEMNVPVLNGTKRRIYQHKYVAGQMQTIETPMGQFRAVAVERTTSRGKYRMTLWCAPELDYWPVRIRRQHIKKGDVTEMNLVEFDPKAPAPVAAD